MMKLLTIFFIGACACLAQAPAISNVTNAALPSLDFPPNSIHLAPRSIATIFGTQLADSEVSATPPWKTTLGGTEVHLAQDDCYDAGCESIADLIYVSPTQINFVVPDVDPSVLWATRLVLVRDGVRFDDRSEILGGPGRIYIDALYDEDYEVVFGVGYDCLYSFSLADPSACGLSWTQGPHREFLGAITDATGRLVTVANPVHQGEPITLWITDLPGLKKNTASGLLEQIPATPVRFGVAQNGHDIPSTLGPSAEGEVGKFESQPPTWAGESPQFKGLDQINVAFPVCSAVPAASEKRYDAFLTYTSVETGTTVRLYVPFLIRMGDPDCQWTTPTTITLASSVNPSTFEQTVAFTANISPPTATGIVTFVDGNSALGTGTLSNGKATFSTSNLSPGSHSITASYSGDSDNKGSTSSPLIQTVNNLPAPTTTTVLTSVLNSSGAVTFTATVSPSMATGTVDFLESDSASCTTGCIWIGSASLNTGTASLTAVLPGGIHSFVAVYNGDGYYRSSTSAALKWTGTNTLLTSSANPATLGQPIIFTATVSPSSATGTVDFIADAGGLPILCSGGSDSLSNGQAKCTASLLVGTHSVTAIYRGNNSNNYSGSSATLTQTVNNAQ